MSDGTPKEEQQPEEQPEQQQQQPPQTSRNRRKRARHEVTRQPRAEEIQKPPSHTEVYRFQPGVVMEIDEAEKHVTFRWDNHGSNFVSLFDELLKHEMFSDCYVSAGDGPTIKVHKAVLSVCSGYFHKLFSEHPSQRHFIVFTEITNEDLQLVLEYMYKGQVIVPQSNLANFMKTCQFLKCKGYLESFAAITGVNLSSPMSPETASSVSSTNDIASSPPRVGSTTPFTTAQALMQAKVEAEAQAEAQALTHEHNPMSLWGAFPTLPLSITPHSFLTGNNRVIKRSYDNSAETSPLSRKKQLSSMVTRDTPILRNVLGQKQDDVSAVTRSSTHRERHNNSAFPSLNNGSAHDANRRRSVDYHPKAGADNEDKCNSPQNYSASHSSQRPGQKPEWKRYKQYTREHIASAMEAVRVKEMSALQAARKFGVPSRTLYDKLKKAGILPSRGAAAQRREPRSTSTGSSAQFPYSSSVNGIVYGSLNRSNAESEHEMNTSGGNRHRSYVGDINEGAGPSGEGRYHRSYSSEVEGAESSNDACGSVVDNSYSRSLNRSCDSNGGDSGAFAASLILRPQSVDSGEGAVDMTRASPIQSPIRPYLPIHVPALLPTLAAVAAAANAAAVDSSNAPAMAAMALKEETEDDYVEDLSMKSNSSIKKDHHDQVPPPIVIFKQEHNRDVTDDIAANS